MKRQKHDTNADAAYGGLVEGKDARPLIRDEDPYFGAEPPSEATLMDEFGFVPSHYRCSGKRRNMDAVADAGEEARLATVVHERQYEETSSKNREETNQAETINRIMDEFEKMTQDKSRYPLAEILNLPPSPGHQTKDDKVFTIDEEIDRQIQEILCTQTNNKFSEVSLPGELFRIILPERPPLSVDLARPNTTEGSFSVEFTLMNPPIRPPVKWRRSEDDMYTPKEVRGTGFLRMGRCNICGIWLKIKQSAYWYHMNFIHGVSASTGRPHPPPIAIRQRAGGESTLVVEGRCGTCQEWVPMQQQSFPVNTTPMDMSSLTSSWWHHVQKCAIAKTKQKTPVCGAKRGRPCNSSRA